MNRVHQAPWDWTPLAKTPFTVLAIEATAATRGDGTHAGTSLWKSLAKTPCSKVVATVATQRLEWH